MEASIVYRPPLDFGTARSVVTGRLYRSGAVVVVQIPTNVPGTSGAAATVHDTSHPGTSTSVQSNLDHGASASSTSRSSVAVPTKSPSSSCAATQSIEKKLKTDYRLRRWLKRSCEIIFGKEQTLSHPAPEHNEPESVSLQSGSVNITGKTMTETKEESKTTTNRFGTKQQWFKWSRISVLGLIFCMC